MARNRPPTLNRSSPLYATTPEPCRFLQDSHRPPLTLFSLLIRFLPQIRCCADHRRPILARKLTGASDTDRAMITRMATLPRQSRRRASRSPPRRPHVHSAGSLGENRREPPLAVRRRLGAGRPPQSRRSVCTDVCQLRFSSVLAECLVAHSAFIRPSPPRCLFSIPVPLLLLRHMVHTSS